MDGRGMEMVREEEEKRDYWDEMMIRKGNECLSYEDQQHNY